MRKIFCVIAAFCALLSFSCDEILMEKDISDRQVTLVAPSNGSQLTSTSLTFSWEAVEGASGYRLQVARPDFENPEQIVLDTLATGTHFSAQLNVGAYEWRVKAVNSEFGTPFAASGFSIVNNQDFQNNVVVLQTPSHNLVTVENTHSLSWQTVIGATSYELQIFDASGTMVSNQNFAATSFSYTFGEGSYQWRVRASNGSQATLYSTRSLFVDSIVPNAPVLLGPANNTNLPEGEVEFEWSRVGVPGTTESDSIYVFSNNTLTSLVFKDAAGSSPYLRNMQAGTFYWYMKTFDAAGNHSAQSTVYSFTAN